MRAQTATRFTATKVARRAAEAFDVSEPSTLVVARSELYWRAMIMRLTPLVSAAVVLSLAGASFAQEWIEFANREDRFTCNFPSPPKVMQITYRSERGADLPARVYSATQGPSRYTVTVVDYNPAQRILTEKAKSCPAGAEPCLGSPGDEGHWKAEIRGAIVYATWRLMQRDAKVTSLVWNTVDLVEGHQLQLTNNADKSRTFAGDLHAREQALCHRGHGAGGLPGAGIVSAVAGMARREWNRTSLSVCLLERIPDASARQALRAAVRSWVPTDRPRRRAR